MRKGKVINSKGEEIVLDDYRKCSVYSMDIDWLDKKVSQLVDWPIDKSEKYNIMKYEVGDFFRPHSDYIDYITENNRVGTLIIYLNTVTEGGQTVFSSRQIKIPAIQGNAVFFNYTKTRKELHAGNRIIQGEKWIATKWFRSDHKPT